MRSWTTGVTVVTSRHENTQLGMTVNSFTSVSLAPPVVTVSLANVARTHALVRRSGVFAVTILERSLESISDRFAGKVVGAPAGEIQHLESIDRFAGVETFILKTGAPMILGGLAHLDCRVIQEVAIGTTTVFFGEVVDVRLGGKGEPLVYLNRIYRRLQL
jgi:flavin reductase